MSLKRYAKLLPGSYHYLSASCFSLFNQADLVPEIYKAAAKDITAQHAHLSPDILEQSHMKLARQFREALLRAGIFGGMSKAINSLQALHRAMPLAYREDNEIHRPEEMMQSASEYLQRGRNFLSSVYGAEQGKNIENALYGLSPRLGHYSVPLVYGCIYADTSALDTRQACVLMFLCNMAVDTPKQAIGHIDSSLRQGSTRQELLDVGVMVRTIAEMYGIKLRHWESVMETVDSGQAQEKNPYEL